MTDRLVPEERPGGWGAVRRRQVSWYDPLPGASAGMAMSGLEYLQAMLAGELPPPPIADLLGFTLASAELGRVVFTCDPDESVYNPIGLVHGGLVCTLLDSAAGCAAQTMLPEGFGYTSLEIKVSYLRPVRLDSGTLTTVGTVRRPGRRVSFTEAVVEDGAGNAVATASSTLLVFPYPSSTAADPAPPG